MTFTSKALLLFGGEGAVEAVELVRKVFPKSRVILYGAYPTLGTQDAQRTSGADVLVCGPITGIIGLSVDLSLYATPPTFTYLSIGASARSSDDLINELFVKADPLNIKGCIRHFAFADHGVIHHFPDHFRRVLQATIDYKLKVSFYALGNIYPRDIIEDPELASLLVHAGFKQIIFADDRDVPLTEGAREAYLESCFQAVEYCIAAGYRHRTEALAASLCLGRPGENIGDITSFMTKLAHVAGSLIAVPYQPSPAQYYERCPGIPLSLELQNGKLFPFAEYNGSSYREYLDVLGLAAVFNAKYRARSFDFLGDSLISRLVQSSLIEESWNPRTISNEQQCQTVVVGWFNKEGKWVRS